MHLLYRGNTLHGGFNPLFENSTWDVLESSSTHVKLHFISPDGAQVRYLALLQGFSYAFSPSPE